MAKRNVSEIETGAGFFTGFVSATMDMVREKAIPFAAIYHLATDGGRTTLAKTYTDQSQPVDKQQSQGGHPYRSRPINANASFTAPVVYVQPEFEELKCQFPAYINPKFEGKRFDPIECCKAVSKENCNVAFKYVHMDHAASTDEVLAEMDRQGLRPALYEELLGFAEKYPDEQRKYQIVALGSMTFVYGSRCVAYLWNDVHGRGLYLFWLVNDFWLGNYWFLAVRK